MNQWIGEIKISVVFLIMHENIFIYIYANLIIDYITQNKY